MLWVVPIRIRRERHRHQQFLTIIIVRERETRRQHADDRTTHAVQLDDSADDIRRTSEVPLPKAVAENDGWRRSQPILLLSKVTAHREGRAQEIEQLPGDHRPLDAL